MRTLRVEEGIIEDNKLKKWSRYGVVENAQLSTTGKIYEEPNDDYFADYLRWAGRGSSEEIPEYLILLNPSPVPQLQKNAVAVDFIQSFDKVTNYILYAAGACQRLRVEEEVSHHLKLRWYSALTDIYDEYRDLITKIPSLKHSNPKVLKASEIAEDIKRDKLKRTVLAKEVMAERRVNKILDVLKDQWHVIDFLNFITKEMLVNNSQEFMNKLVQGIKWPLRDMKLPYQLMMSGSSHQFYLPAGYCAIREEHEEHGEHEGHV